MRYWYDTEFLEDGRTIELISIGILAEDGREYYAVVKDADWKRINKDEWLRRNVLVSLPRFYGDARLHYSSRRNPMSLDFGAREFKPRAVIADEVSSFLSAGERAELWADYGAYDHVVLCQLWGRMIDLPDGLPMYTNDIQQEARRLGVTDLPQQADGLHNALADARHCRERWQFLRDIAGSSN